ncbi:MAG: cob(I)yrinic acid a,c-diamide adenosyltransferase [Candidatus Wildermuthbacteria bacterium]|nr:cob(I)yrinic acid a,c-diamide adenosyltransferase [Candidatus Wildermuthbacteria bacterium]
MSKFFYTGKGDRGESNIGGKKIPKDSIEIEAVGALDEINSLLGLAKNQKFPDKTFKDILQQAQENLFNVQAHVGCYMIGGDPPDFPEEKVRKVEQLIDRFEKEVQPKRGFIVSGETAEAAWLDYARTVARRAEIALIKLNKKMQAEGKILEPNTLAYMNRLSSLLYAMARLLAKKHGKEEQHPSY